MKKIDSILRCFIVAVLTIMPLVFHAEPNTSMKMEVHRNVKDMAKHVDKVQFSATPQILEEVGNKIVVTIEVMFPPKYFDKKTVMNVTPVLVYDAGQTDLPAMNFIGEKVEGQGVVISHDNGGTYSYTTTIKYNDKMANSVLMVEPIIYTYKNKVHPDRASIKTKEDFALCDAMLLAEGVITTAKNVDKSLMRVAYVKPSDERVVNHEISDIYFNVNSDNINWNVPLNQVAQNKEALQNMTAHIADGWEIQNITITGWASPEGPVQYNVTLSDNRADMVDTFVKKRLAALAGQKGTKVSYSNVNDVKITCVGNGPDWNGLMEAVKKSNIKDKQMIINTLSVQTEQQRVAQLNKYIKQYPELEKTILPSLRHVVIDVNTVEPKMTSDQMVAKASDTPSDLTCNQLIVAASMVKDLKHKEKIYVNAVQTYPDCCGLYCNAGAVAIEQGNTKHAKKMLQQALQINDLLAEAYNNLGIVAVMENNYDAAASYFNQAQSLGLNTDYNMGVVHIDKGNYGQAVQLMSKNNPNCDYNIALAQTLDKKYTLAEETATCLQENGQTLYLQAVIAARTKNVEKALKHLGKAIKSDVKMKEKAKKDKEFAVMKNDPVFMALVQ